MLITVGVVGFAGGYYLVIVGFLAIVVVVIACVVVSYFVAIVVVHLCLVGLVDATDCQGVSWIPECVAVVVRAVSV